MNALPTIGKWLGGALAAAWAVWFVAGVADDTGPMGWLNALQQDAVGSHSSKLSVLAGCLVFGLLVLPFAVDSALDGAARAVAAQTRTPTADPAPAAARPWPWAVKALLWPVVLALVWAAAIGGSAWQARTRSLDAAAAYPPFPLEGAAGATVPQRMALDGRWLWNHTVEKTAGSESTANEVYVPIAPVAWTEGEPVAIVARLTRFEARQQARGPAASATVRVKVDGAIPTPAVAVFQRLRAPLAAGAVLVAVVPAPDASAGPPGIDWFDVRFWGGLGTLVVAFTALGVFLMHRGSGRDA